MLPTETHKIILYERAHYRTSVCLDDFIGAAVKNTSRTLLERIFKSDLHGIHIIYPPSGSNRRYRREGTDII